MKRTNLQKLADRDKNVATTRRLPGKARGESGKAPPAGAEQQVDEVERTFSVRWEW